MDDYISRQAAINALMNDIEPFVIVEPGTTCVIGAGIKDSDVIKMLEAMPSADVQPVRHGHWIEHVCELFPAEGTVECSECHEHESIFLVNDKYCPNCGVKMDGEQNG